ncbi:methyl-CpG-binding domain protein [Acrasis kona]|uniref:Methyl-CpG-binding domain protein 4 n=1 Tax=Acrasis kona TaxID=1008807 RepID=A0AAW2Z4L7_9EUKA
MKRELDNSVDDQDICEVEHILKKRTRGKKTQYLVKWVGHKDPTWEPAYNMNGCKEALDQFEGSSKIIRKESKYIPPKSKYNLMQERYYSEPWKMLVGCILLNVTTGRQMKDVMLEILERWPTPKHLTLADDDELRELLTPLGLANKRTLTLKRFSQEWINGNWTLPDELYGIGQYGCDSYRIFVLGEWDKVSPTDKELIRYVEWMRENNCNTTLAGGKEN